MAPLEFPHAIACLKYHGPSPVEAIASTIPLNESTLTSKRGQSELDEEATEGFYRSCDPLSTSDASSTPTPSPDNVDDPSLSKRERDSKKGCVQFDFSMRKYHRREGNELQKDQSSFDESDDSWFDLHPYPPLASPKTPAEYYIPTELKKKFRPYTGSNASDPAFEYRRILENLPHSPTRPQRKDTSSNGTESHQQKGNPVDRLAEKSVTEPCSPEPNTTASRRRRHSISTAYDDDLSYPASEATPVDLRDLKAKIAESRIKDAGVNYPDKTLTNTTRYNKSSRSSRKPNGDEKANCITSPRGPNKEGSSSKLPETDNYTNRNHCHQEQVDKYRKNHFSPESAPEMRQQEDKQLKGILKWNPSTLQAASPPSYSCLRPDQCKASTSQQHLPLNNRMMDGNIHPAQRQRRMSLGRSDHHRDRRRIEGHMNSNPYKRASMNRVDIRGGSASHKPKNSSNARLEGPLSLPSRSRSLELKRSSRMIEHAPISSLSTRSNRYSLPASQKQRAFSLSPTPVSTPPLNSVEQPLTRSNSAKCHRSSSIKSTTSLTSLKPHKSRQSKKQTELGRQETLAALTAPAPQPEPKMTPECRALLAAQEKAVQDKIKRDAVAAERAARISQHRRFSKSKQGSMTPVIIPNGECSTSGALKPFGFAAGGDGKAGCEEMRGGLTAEDVRLLREREKVMRWKAEREKLRFERRGSVGRGGEEGEGERKKQAVVKKKGRWFCGFF